MVALRWSDKLYRAQASKLLHEWEMGKRKLLDTRLIEQLGWPVAFAAGSRACFNNRAWTLLPPDVSDSSVCRQAKHGTAAERVLCALFGGGLQVTALFAVFWAPLFVLYHLNKQRQAQLPQEAIQAAHGSERACESERAAVPAPEAMIMAAVPRECNAGGSTAAAVPGSNRGRSIICSSSDSDDDDGGHFNPLSSRSAVVGPACAAQV